LSGAPPQEESSELARLVEQLNEVVERVVGGETSPLEALKQISDIIGDREDIIRGDENIYNSIVELQATLAYNAVASGVDPDEVNPYLLDEARARLQGMMGELAPALIANAILAGDVERARRIYAEYSEHVPSELRGDLEVLLSPEFQALSTAVGNEDAQAILDTVKSLRGAGRYEEFRRVWDKYAGVSLEEIVGAAAANVVYGILVSSQGPGDALARLREALGELQGLGLDQLYADLEAAVAALEAAGRGDARAFVEHASRIGDSGVRRYAIVKGVSALFEEHPEALAGLDDATIQRLDEMLRGAGFQGGLGSLRVLVEGLRVALDLNKMISEGHAGAALELWRGLSDELREAAALVLGMGVGEIGGLLEEYARLEEAAGEAAALAEMVRGGDYEGAYRRCLQLEEKCQLIAQLLGTAPEELLDALAVGAALQAVAALENPTLDEVKRVLAEYLGEERAEAVARELLEESPLYRVKVLADEGRFEEALAAALQAPEEERGLAVKYVLAAVAEKGGAGALAEFIEAHRGVLEPYLDVETLRAVELVSGAGEVARGLARALEEAAVEEIASRISGIVEEYVRRLEARDWEGAEELLVRNRGILSLASLDDGTGLAEYLGELYTAARAADIIDRGASRLEELAGGGDPGAAAREAERIARQAEAYMQSLSQARHLGDARDKYVEALRRLAAHAHALRAQALMVAGDLDAAVQAAARAAELDPQFRRLHAAARIVSVLARDSDRLYRDLKCVLENVVGIRPTAVGNRRPQVEPR